MWENKEKNLRNAKRDLELLLKDRKIQLALFPEMSFTGFSINTRCSPFLRQLRRLRERTFLSRPWRLGFRKSVRASGMADLHLMATDWRKVNEVKIYWRKLWS